MCGPVAVLLATGCATYSDEAPRTDDVPAAAVERQPLPALGPGATREDIVAAVASWPPGHRFTLDGVRPEGWEWTGPDGMRIEATFDDATVHGVRLSRTWGTGAPAIDARRLPDALSGRPLDELEARVGPGLLVSRAWSAAEGIESATIEEYKWAIHDHGVDTGLFLTVRARDGAVHEIAHRWSRR